MRLILLIVVGFFMIVACGCEKSLPAIPQYPVFVHISERAGITLKVEAPRVTQWSNMNGFVTGVTGEGVKVILDQNVLIVGDNNYGAMKRGDIVFIDAKGNVSIQRLGDK